MEQDVERPRVVAIGEVLWDLFPDGTRLGGAPANFAVHAATLGAESVLVSRVGSDGEGLEALAQLRNRGVDTGFVQEDAERPTGTVRVTLTNGQPAYEIVAGVAWDAIALEQPSVDLLQDARALCFGTLAQRETTSRGTVQQLVGQAPETCLKVLDINFRQHYHSRDVVRRAVCFADVLKLNAEEVSVLREYLGGSDDPRLFCRDIRERFEIGHVVLTMGAGGCRVIGAEGDIRVAAAPQEVVNTVGAGDAFTAAFVLNLLSGADIRTCAEQANAAGGFVTTQDSGTPVFPGSFRVFPER